MKNRKEKKEQKKLRKHEDDSRLLDRALAGLQKSNCKEW